MKIIRYILLLICLISAINLFSLQLNKGSVNLNDSLQIEAAAEEFFPVFLIMKDQYDSRLLYSRVRELPKSERREQTITTLRNHSLVSQRKTKELLERLIEKGLVVRARYLWITNVIGLEATPEALKVIDTFPDVVSIEYDPPTKVLIDAIDDYERIDEPLIHDSGAERQMAWNIPHMNVPEVWDLGFFGQDVLVAVLDTGVNYNHYDIRNRMWENELYPNHGWDFSTDSDDPMDIYDHGTHCAGSIAGDGTSGTQTGVAPQSRIMALKIYTDTGYSQHVWVWDALEFALTHNVDVLSMSFGWYQTDSSNPQRASWRNVMANILSVGVPAALAAGNEATHNDKPIPLNVRTPGCNPPPWLNPDQVETGGTTAVITIGATNSSDGIASFSSRGPVTWQDIDPFFDYPYNPGIGLIRPDVTAPGVNIPSLSHVNLEGYSIKSGTSMATPNAAGVIALMLSKEPSLTPEDISRIFELTSVSLTESKSNTFGAGRVDALSAINAILIDEPPHQAFNPRPLNSAHAISLNTILSWYNGGFADSYYVYLGTDNPPTNILNGLYTEDLSITLPQELENSTRHYWRVDSENSSGVTTGTVWSFITEIPVTENFESGEFLHEEWVFTTTGTNAEEWFVTSDSSANGSYSARSGNIGHNSSTTMSIRLEIIEDGVITFYRRVSSEPDYDRLRFYIGNDIYGEWSGEQTWERFEYPVSAGFRTFRWVYSKDPLTSLGEDAAWIDDITFPPHPVPPVKYKPHSINYELDYENVALEWAIEIDEHVNPILFSLLGFNLFRRIGEERDYVQLNSEIITEYSYQEELIVEGHYSYYLTAVYRVMGQIEETEPSESIAFNILSTLAPPVVTPPGGSYDEIIDVTIDYIEGSMVFYTTDGSEPSLESERYVEPIEINESTHLKTRAYKIGHLPSEVVSNVYEISLLSIEDVVQPLVFSTKIYPNPFSKGSSLRNSSHISIECSLPEDSKYLEITVYNIRGQQVHRILTGNISRGVHSFTWDFKDSKNRIVGNGVYLLRIRTEQQSDFKRLMLIK